MSAENDGSALEWCRSDEEAGAAVDEEVVSAEGGAQDEAAHSEVATDDGSEGGG